ncbi:hypothetical protein [Nocardiopsis alba]|uniref:hypothetical protein n=1 Tax=Nocardiopsis alba TaxID=53437 RepID=UPI0033BAE1B1
MTVSNTARPHSPGVLASAPWAALAWSAVALGLGIGWGAGLLPVGVPTEDGFGSLFVAAGAGAATAASSVMGVLGVVLSLVVLSGRAWWGRAVEFASWAMAGVAFLVFVDGQLLAWLGYTMILPVVGWTVPGLAGAWLEATLRPTHLTVLFFALGVLVWGSAALYRRRAVGGACPRCGRDGHWTPRVEARVRERARRMGVIAVTAGSAVALVYPVLRLPWLFGIPMGMDPQVFEEMTRTGEHIVVGVGLGSAALVGVALMSGLVLRWGVRLPWWTLGLAGRRVPVSLAVVPATVVSLALLSMGRSWLVMLGETDPARWSDPNTFALLSMGVWGVALAVATVAYAVRRRSECGRCGRGAAEGGAAPVEPGEEGAVMER